MTSRLKRPLNPAIVPRYSVAVFNLSLQTHKKTSIKKVIKNFRWKNLFWRELKRSREAVNDSESFNDGFYYLPTKNAF